VTCQAMTRIGWEQTAWNGIRSRRTNPTLLLHTLHVTRAHSPSLPPPSPRGRGVLTHLGSPSRVAFVQSRDRMERQGKPGTSQACNTRDDKSSRRERAKRPGPDDQAQVHEQKAAAVVHACSAPPRPFLQSHVPSLYFFSRMLCCDTPMTLGLGCPAVLSSTRNRGHRMGEKNTLRRRGGRAAGRTRETSISRCVCAVAR
jgi:hypothetical protein